MLRISFLCSLLLAFSTAASAEDTIIVHPSAAVASLGTDEVKDLFLGRKGSWPDGSKVTVAVVKDHEGFAALVGKSSSQFVTGWKKLVFTGKGVMPEILDTPEAVAAFVAKTPGAIGYVDASKAGGCKPIAIK